MPSTLPWNYDPGIIRVIGIDMGDYLNDQYGHLFIGDMSVDPQSGRIHVAATALGNPQLHSTSHLFVLTVTGLEAGNPRLQIPDSVIGDLSGDPVLVQYTVGDVRVASPIATLPPQTCELTSTWSPQVVVTNQTTILSRPLLEASIEDMVGTISNTTANVLAVVNDKSGVTFLQISCNDRTGWILLTGDMSMIGTWRGIPRTVEPIATVAASSEAITSEAVVNSDRNVNLRSGPGTDYATVTVVQSRTRVRVLSFSTDREWIRVQLNNGQQGWISAALLTINGS